MIGTTLSDSVAPSMATSVALLAAALIVVSFLDFPSAEGSPTDAFSGGRALRQRRSSKVATDLRIVVVVSALGFSAGMGATLVHNVVVQLAAVVLGFSDVALFAIISLRTIALLAPSPKK